MKSLFYKIIKKIRCGDLVLNQTFKVLDQPLLCTTTLATATDSELEESH